MPGQRQALPRLVIVVPAHDEEESIEGVIGSPRTLEPEFAALGCDLRVYVVDDGSTDATRARAQTARADRVLRHGSNRGLGAAVRTGLLAARADGAALAAKFDADGQHEARDLLRLVRPLLEDGADVVYGDRTRGIRYRMPMVRRAGNAVFTGLMRRLTGWPVRDSQPGIFAVGAGYLESFWLPGDYNYTQQLLLDAYHRGLRFEHAEVTFKPRSGGRSFVSYRYPFLVLSQIVLVLAGVKPMRVFAPLGLGFIALAAVTFGWQFGEWLVAGAAKPVRSVNFVLGTGLFGLQTFFFGLLAELVVRRQRH
jgi:glycosyltransferase involved in cell wall biosynthesis